MQQNGALPTTATPVAKLPAWCILVTVSPHSSESEDASHKAKMHSSKTWKQLARHGGFIPVRSGTLLPTDCRCKCFPCLPCLARELGTSYCYMLCVKLSSVKYQLLSSSDRGPLRHSIICYVLCPVPDNLYFRRLYLYQTPLDDHPVGSVPDNNNTTGSSSHIPSSEMSLSPDWIRRPIQSRKQSL